MSGGNEVCFHNFKTSYFFAITITMATTPRKVGYRDAAERRDELGYRKKQLKVILYV